MKVFLAVTMLASATLLLTGCLTSWPPVMTDEIRQDNRAIKNVALVIQGDQQAGTRSKIKSIADYVLGKHGIQVIEDDTLRPDHEATLIAKISVGKWRSGPSQLEKSSAEIDLIVMGKIPSARMFEASRAGDDYSVITSIHRNGRMVYRRHNKYAAEGNLIQSQLEERVARLFTEQLIVWVHQVFGVEAVLNLLIAEDIDWSIARSLNHGVCYYLLEGIDKKPNAIKDSIPMAALLNVAVDDSDWLKRLVAVRLLGVSGNWQVVKTLIDALSDSYFVNDWYPVRWWAEQGLEEITGQNLGEASNPWRQWWSTEGKNLSPVSQ